MRPPTEDYAHDICIRQSMQYGLYEAICQRPSTQCNLRNVFYTRPFLGAISTKTFHKRYKSYTTTEGTQTTSLLRAIMAAIAMGAMTDPMVATNSYDSYNSYNGYIRYNCRIVTKVTMTKNFIGTKTGYRNMTDTERITDIRPTIATRATTVSRIGGNTRV